MAILTGNTIVDVIIVIIIGIVVIMLLSWLLGGFGHPFWYARMLDYWGANTPSFIASVSNAIS
jgi:hypothetical protein